jgi:siroheme synthase-like protein
MSDLPVMLKVRGRRCLIVGGGGVARRRAGALLEAGAFVTVVAPQIDPELAQLPIHVEVRTYRGDDLDEVMLVIVATDNETVNQQVSADARARGVLVNRADDPDEGDITIPAHTRHGPITLAVHTGGISASASAEIRRRLTEALDPDWATLLQLVAPYRARIQQSTPDRERRRTLLASLTNDTAMALLKQTGPQAVVNYCERLLEPGA